MTMDRWIDEKKCLKKRATAAWTEPSESDDDDGWNGTDGATTRFVTFGFGREKRANDDDVDGDDEATTTREGRRFTRRFIDSSIHSFVHSFVRSRSVCFLRSRARRVDSLATTTTTTTGGGGSRRRLETRVRTSRVDAGSERR
jgi:hypothetical protein